MKKERFLGYLDALMDMAEAYQFNEDQIPELIGDIRKKAEELELVEHTIPYSPTPWWDPYKPYVTWTTDKIELDNQSDFEYNGIRIKKDPTLPDPNDWSIEQNTPGRPDFTVVK